MEDIDGKIRPRTKLYDVFILIILLAILSICVFMLLRVQQHILMFENDPLVFGAITHNITICSCTNNENKEFSFNQTAIRYIVIPNNSLKHQGLINITLT